MSTITRTLYLTSAATSSPWPTTSRKVSETANSSEVTLSAGYFTCNGPGDSDAGQWNPSSSRGSTSLAYEIDNNSSTIGPTRQGWLYDEDLTGYKLIATGEYRIQLRLRSLLDVDIDARPCLRVTVVSANSGQWTTVKNVLTTSISNGTTTSGQAGWHEYGLRNVSPIFGYSTNYNLSMATTGSQEHTFASGERLLFELGFCDAPLDDGSPHLAWRLDYNTSNSYIQIDLDANIAAGGVATGTFSAVGATTLVAGAVAGGVAAATFSGVGATAYATGTTSATCTRFYAMRGYRYDNSPPDFEVWIDEDTPTETNPSGDPIQDITVASTWRAEGS